MEVKSDAVKSSVALEHEIRPMNQGKLEVVKHVERVNIDILGISEPRKTGVGEFNSDDHYIYHCGQESLRRKGVAIIVKKKKSL